MARFKVLPCEAIRLHTGKLMLKLLLPVSLAASTLLSSAASSEEVADSIFTVEPGMWTWSHETMLFGIPISEENTECLTPEVASMSLEDFAQDLDEGCSVGDLVKDGNTTRFTLTCTGRYSGTAEGSFRKISDQQIEISADGLVRLSDDIEAPFSFDARAKRKGSCS